jgi:hypothetical protein
MFARGDTVGAYCVGIIGHGHGRTKTTENSAVETQMGLYIYTPIPISHIEQRSITRDMVLKTVDVVLNCRFEGRKADGKGQKGAFVTCNQC